MNAAKPSSKPTFHRRLFGEIEVRVAAELEFLQLGQLLVILLPISAHFQRTAERLIVERVQIIWRGNGKIRKVKTEDERRIEEKVRTELMRR